MDTQTKSPFAKLSDYLADLHNLNMTQHMLFWDQNVMMPSGGSDARAAQLATLQRVRHERLTSERTMQLIEAAEAEVDMRDPDSDAARLIAVARADYEHARALPADFVAEYARVTSGAFEVWKRAKAAKDYAIFTPALQRILDLKLQEADMRGYDDHPYDVLLDHWERGMTTARVRQLFDAHRDALVELAAAVNANSDRVDDSVLRQPFDVEKQRELSLLVSKAVGIDYDNWARLDTAPHPFCLQIAKYDIRVTTRFDPNFFNAAFYSTLHESGHGLHGHGIGTSLDGTFLSDMEFISQAIAESQSRTWENLVGRSRAFWEWFFPHAQAIFPEQFANVDAETVYKAVNRSYPQFSRVEADELTYNLHIMLRFEIELALVEGKVSVADVPELWNAKFDEYFGIVPPDVAAGPLQDVHWSMGGIGAFVGYALGNLLAAQFYRAALDANPAIPEQVARGEFDTLRSWLTDTIYVHGRKFDADEMARRVTGEGMQSQDFVAYLQQKYGELYDL
ncbi:MAG: carboxypeptidase M32 [Chloroflexota bacterium]